MAKKPNGSKAILAADLYSNDTATNHSVDQFIKIILSLIIKYLVFSVIVF